MNNPTAAPPEPQNSRPKGFPAPGDELTFARLEFRKGCPLSKLQKRPENTPSFSPQCISVFLARRRTFRRKSRFTRLPYFHRGPVAAPSPLGAAVQRPGAARRTFFSAFRKPPFSQRWGLLFKAPKRDWRAPVFGVVFRPPNRAREFRLSKNHN